MSIFDTPHSPEELAARDIMVNCAVTVVPRRNGVHDIGPSAEDFEVCQFAAEIFNKKLPLKESHARRMMEEISAKIIETMRHAGMIRS